MLLFVTAHRLFQIFSANKDIDAYASLYHYRLASTKRTTFHYTLLTCQYLFNKRLKELEQEANKENALVQTNQQRRVLPNRRLIDNVIPENITFGPSLPSRTPKKITKHVTEGIACKEIEDMVHNCTGMPIKVHKENQQRCNFCCTQKTSWYCVGCKRWLCIDRRNTKDNSKLLNLYKHIVKGKPLYFHKQCFHIAHEAAWRKATETSDDDNRSSGNISSDDSIF